MASPQNKSFKAILALYVKKTEKDMSQWFMKEKSLSIVLFVILATPKNKIWTRHIDEIHEKKKKQTLQSWHWYNKQQSQAQSDQCKMQMVFQSARWRWEFLGTAWSNESDENPPEGDTKPPGGDNHEVCCLAAQLYVKILLQ